VTDNQTVSGSGRRRAPLSANAATPAAEEAGSWLTAVRAAEAKKAQDIVVLDLRDVTSFTDYFVICSGTNARQNQAISDEIYQQLKTGGELPVSLEGYEHAEWILQDYGDFVVHVFLPQTREFYDLERLWRHARPVPVPAPAHP
jgi:ribosome-associated protein